MNGTLQTALKELRLSGLAGALDVRLQEAAGNRLSHAEFLELVLQDEITVRKERLIARRIKYAALPELKTLEDFDWSFNAAIKRKPFYDLATGQFIREARDLLLIGPPGTGKTHLAVALGYQAIKLGFTVLYRSIFDLVREFMQDEAFEGVDQVLRKYLRADLVIIDDMGLKQLAKRSGEYLFEVIMRRYENRATIMTSNRPIEEWGKLIGDVPAATAILDRFRLNEEAPKQGRATVTREKNAGDSIYGPPTQTASHSKTRLPQTEVNMYKRRVKNQPVTGWF